MSGGNFYHRYVTFRVRTVCSNSAGSGSSGGDGSGQVAVDIDGHNWHERLYYHGRALDQSDALIPAAGQSDTPNHPLDAS